MRATLWRLHKWLGVMSCVGVVLWGVSGILHPIMSRLQPKPAQFMPPLQRIDLRDAQPLATVLNTHGMQTITQAGLATVQGVPAYRIALPGTPEALYFNTHTGQVIQAGDARQAEQLARHYTGLATTPIKVSSLITAFDSDYPAVNRILPVWRVEFDQQDGLRAYVDTSQARLVTLSDNTRAVLSPLFRALHNWTFFEGNPLLQVVVISAVLLCVLFSACSGIYFYLLMRPSAARRLSSSPLKRTHRALGIAVSLTAITATVSGFYHLIQTWQRDTQPAPRIEESFAVNVLPSPAWRALAAKSLSRANLARLNGEVVWEITPAGAAMGPRAQVAHLARPHDEHADHAPATKPARSGPASEVILADGTTLANGAEALARDLASRHAGLSKEAIVSVEKITKFGGEYGFVFKRLPVYRVQFSGPGNPRYYVETTTGTLASRVDDWDALEGKSFSYLHKWHLTDAGKDLRDILLALFTLGNVVVAIMGLVLFKRRRKSETTAYPATVPLTSGPIGKAPH